MASKGIVINFLSDVRDFLRGTSDVEEALDDVVDSLEDVSKDGDKAAEKLADSFKDNMKEVSRAAREAGDGIGSDLNRGTKKAEEGLDDLKKNSESNAKEVTASFDGSVESIVDGFQGLAAEAFEGFGPAGLIAGAALAAGIGLATAEFQKSEEAAQKAKERVADLGTAFIESGADIAQVEAFQEALKGIITNADDAAVKVDDLRKLTKKYGDQVPSVAEFATAYAGNADAIESVTEQLEAAIKAEEDKTFKTKAGADASREKQEAYQGEIDKLQGIQEEAELAAQIEEEWLAAGGAEAQAKADAIGTINAAYDDVVGSILDYKDEETGLLDTQAFIDAIKARQDQLKQYQTDLASMGLTTEQKAALDDMGIEAASAYLEGIKSGTPEQADFLKKSLTEAAKDSSGVAKKEIEKAFEKPTEAKVKAVAETEAAQKDLDNLIKARTAVIKVDFQDRNGKRVY